MLKFRPQIAIILVITQFWTSSYNLTSKIPFLKCVEANKIILRNQWFPHFLCEVVCDVDSKRQPPFTVVNRETSHNPPFPRYTFIWMWECDSGPEKALCPCPLYPPRPHSHRRLTILLDPLACHSHTFDEKTLPGLPCGLEIHLTKNL